MAANEVANAFVQHYYQAFDSNAEGLRGLFQEGSMLTFEGSQIQGSNAIVDKLKSVGPVKHSVKSIDIQPSHTPNAILIFVTGHIQIGAGSENSLHFCESFNLVSSSPGNYYVHNDIFRLNYA